MRISPSLTRMAPDSLTSFALYVQPQEDQLEQNLTASAHQSGLASPGAGRNARWREITRSELVTVPSFSPQASAGSSRCASCAVSVDATTSETTTNSQRRSASRTRSTSGRLTTGLVDIIHRSEAR